MYAHLARSVFLVMVDFWSFRLAQCCALGRDNLNKEVDRIVGKYKGVPLC